LLYCDNIKISNVKEEKKMQRNTITSTINVRIRTIKHGDMMYGMQNVVDTFGNLLLYTWFSKCTFQM
jgi:hypothetical protein